MSVGGHHQQQIPPAGRVDGEAHALPRPKPALVVAERSDLRLRMGERTQAFDFSKQSRNVTGSRSQEVDDRVEAIVRGSQLLRPCVHIDVELVISIRICALNEAAPPDPCARLQMSGPGPGYRRERRFYQLHGG